MLSSIPPVNLFIFSLRTPATIKIKATSIAMGKSRTSVCFDIIRPCLLTKAEAPITTDMFIIFAPKIFPVDILCWPLIVAVSPVTNSGIEVPTASNVRLTTCFGIRNICAIFTPLSTSI